MLRWPDYRRYTRLKEAYRSGERRIIYAPTAEELRDERFTEAFFRWVYMRKNTFCYVDEVYAVTERDEMPDHYHALMTRGRERNSGVLSASQRPIKIPNTILSESERWYMFRLTMPPDRKKVQESIGVPEETLARLPKQEFLYVEADSDVKLGPMKLTL